MNAKAKRTDLQLVIANHEMRMEKLRRDLLTEILAETVRINRSGRAVTIALSTNHVYIYVHEKSTCEMYTSSLSDEEALIDLLEKLEHVTDPVFDLEEVTTDAEAV